MSDALTVLPLFKWSEMRRPTVPVISSFVLYVLYCSIGDNAGYREVSGIGVCTLLASILWERSLASIKAVPSSSVVLLDHDKS